MSYCYISIHQVEDIVFDDITALNEDILDTDLGSLYEDLGIGQLATCRNTDTFMGFLTFKNNELKLADGNGDAFRGYQDTIPTWHCFNTDACMVIANHLISGKLVLKQA